METLYFSTDDKVYGTKFVYCGQHLRVHETGWCKISVINKIPLLSQTIEDAHREWTIKKQLLNIKSPSSTGPVGS